ncbi:MAG: hypothetical protein MUD17_08410 [Gemmatimonadaceae bacterium]|nr:hypothetical protein [Gemmatimonadaceae bacterium]
MADQSTISRDRLREKLTESMNAPIPVRTARDVRVPGIPGKALAVVGVRRGGKTSFLQRRMADQLAAGRSRESQLLLELEDERLAGMSAADLGWIVDEHTRRYRHLACPCTSTKCRSSRVGKRSSIDCWPPAMWRSRCPARRPSC